MDVSLFFQDLPRPRKRLTELMHKTAFQPTPTDEKLWAQADREWELRFRLSPLEILARSGIVRGVRFGVNKLEVYNLVFCLFVLRFNAPVNNFSVMSGQRVTTLGIGALCVFGAMTYFMANSFEHEI